MVATTSGRRLWSAWVGVLATAAVLVLPARAGATPGFVSQIKSELNAPTVPSCALCHATTAGGGPVTQPFGKSMLARGLRGGNAASLTTALQALAAEGTDSDGDGVGDIEELSMGLDPNFAGDAGTEPPVFGCAQVAPGTPEPTSAAIALGCALALLVHRRRRTR